LGLHVSVVSHGQGPLVRGLLEDLDRHCAHRGLRVTLTLNRAEPVDFDARSFAFPLRLVRNEHPRGFGANHNAAFDWDGNAGGADAFCVLNPDLRLSLDPFPPLQGLLNREPAAGVVAPLVRGPDGGVEDSARRVPTPFSIAAKALGKGWGAQYAFDARPRPVQWVAGMFMLFPAAVFASLRGFDERYHLYYEDVDICCRLRLAGYRVLVHPAVSVVHDARRASHGDLQHRRWHLASMARFFASGVFLRCWWRLRRADL
jgi:N-acetylglucosaminyl-diphospho-decaprenol L-rhamnosyltransferase